MLKNTVLLFFVLINVSLWAQTSSNDSILAANYFNNEEYNNALKEYLKIYKTQKEDTAVNYRIGLCYLNINDDKAKAIPYLEYVYNKGGYRDELLMHLGMAYMYAYKFDDALTFFNYYRKIIYSKKFELLENYYEDAADGKIDFQKKITVGNFGKIDHLIENCENASEIVKSPLNVTFENMGPDINSKYPDYNPYVTKEEGVLYFTSRRGDAPQKLKSWQGYFTSDIYYTRVEDGQWNKAAMMGDNINTPDDEECVYVSADGLRMIICEENATVVDDLFSVSLEAPKPKPFAYSEPINTTFRELQGCEANEGNTIFFVSDREGGLGETDIYVVKKLPTGDWGAPKNLGAAINTKYKEAYPYFDEKNNVLYFASEGHVNIGGYDIFSAEYIPEENRFEPAINMGYPINTPEDNLEISMAENGRDGYISAYRNGGFGDLDIYKVTFSEIEKRPSVLRGVIALNNPDSGKTDIDAMVILKDLLTNRTIDSKNVNPNTGRYIFAVETGKYSITVKSAGYIDAVKEINVYDKADYVFEIENSFTLRRIGDTTAAVLDTQAVKPTIAAPVITEIADKKAPEPVVIKGVVSTSDLETLQKDITITIALLDSKTNQVIESKKLNLKNSGYSFSMSAGNYYLRVESEGYENFNEQIKIAEKPHVLIIDKNIVLKRITSENESSNLLVNKTELNTEKSKEEIKGEEVKQLLNSSKTEDVASKHPTNLEHESMITKENVVAPKSKNKSKEKAVSAKSSKQKTKVDSKGTIAKTKSKKSNPKAKGKVQKSASPKGAKASSGKGAKSAKASPAKKKTAAKGKKQK